MTEDQLNYLDSDDLFDADFDTVTRAEYELCDYLPAECLAAAQHAS